MNMSDELKQLAGEAAALDADTVAAVAATGGAPEPEQAPLPTIDPAESLAGLLSVVGMAAGVGGLKRTAAIWTHDTCRALADKAVPVMRKYPWGVKVLGFLETGAGVEEMALFAVAAPLALATINAVRADLAPPPEPEPTDYLGDPVGSA